MEANGSGLRLRKVSKGSFSGSFVYSPCSSPPAYCGFAPTTLMEGSSLYRWESARAGELEEEDMFKKFEELWQAKWHGDGGLRVEYGSQDEAKKSFTKKHRVQKVESSEKRKQSRGKFQFAEGFEDWGIPQYPEDYVDPAEMCSESELSFR